MASDVLPSSSLPHPSSFHALISSYSHAKSAVGRKHSDSAECVETASRRLSDLVNYVESTKFRGLDAPRRYWERSSFDESK